VLVEWLRKTPLPRARYLCTDFGLIAYSLFRPQTFVKGIRETESSVLPLILYVISPKNSIISATKVHFGFSLLPATN